MLYFSEVQFINFWIMVLESYPRNLCLYKAIKIFSDAFFREFYCFKLHILVCDHFEYIFKIWHEDQRSVFAYGCLIVLSSFAVYGGRASLVPKTCYEHLLWEVKFSSSGIDAQECNCWIYEKLPNYFVVHVFKRKLGGLRTYMNLVSASYFLVIWGNILNISVLQLPDW